MQIAMAKVTCDVCGREFKVAGSTAAAEYRCPDCGSGIQTRPGPPPLPRARTAIREPVPAEEDAWLDHGGEPLPDDAKFFAPPPTSIGPVLSSFSTRRRGQKPWPIWAFVLVAGAAGAFTLIAIVAFFVFQPTRLVGMLIFVGAFFAGAVPITFALKRFAHTCTYVGRDGVARFRAWGRGGRVRREIFLFDDADELRVSVVDNYMNFAYSNTDYSYQWRDNAGQLWFRIKGNHGGKDANPVSTDPFHFARAAENAWTKYLFVKARKRLDDGRVVRFNLKSKGRWVGIRPGAIVFCLGGEEETWTAKELGAVSFKKGVISFHVPGVKGSLALDSGQQGKFNASNLANSGLFLALVAEELGLEPDQGT